MSSLIFKILDETSIFSLVSASNVIEIASVKNFPCDNNNLSKGEFVFIYKDQGSNNGIYIVLRCEDPNEYSFSKFIEFENRVKLEDLPQNVQKEMLSNDFVVLSQEETEQIICKICSNIELQLSSNQHSIVSSVKKLSIPHQKIFYGVPGSGKSFKVKDIISKNFSPTHRFYTTFHPEYDYKDFVGSYKPYSRYENGKNIIEYKFIPQIFINAYIDAWKHPDENIVLDIEELNRGKCSAIFGDFFQLLDRDNSGYSCFPIKVDYSCSNYLAEKLTDTLYYKTTISQLLELSGDFDFSFMILPPNFYIFATINTSDQSLFPMDSAFKRRWDWEYVPINYSLVKDIYIEISDKEKYPWSDFLQKVNEKIYKITLSEDKQLGPFFVQSTNNSISLNTFKNKVLFYLWNDIYKDEQNSIENIFKDKKGNPFSFKDLYSSNSNELIQDIFLRIGLCHQELSFNKNSTVVDSNDYQSETSYMDGSVESN